MGGPRTRPRELAEGVSFAKFAGLARRKEWSAEYLAEHFRGKFQTGNESLERWFERVLADRLPNGKPTDGVVIPYRCVVEKFLQTVDELARDGKLALCVCGCGSYAGGGGRQAWPKCSVKVSPAQQEARRLAALKGVETRMTRAAERREQKRLLRAAEKGSEAQVNAYHFHLKRFAENGCLARRDCSGN
jgi:hypothetical protein